MRSLGANVRDLDRRRDDVGRIKAEVVTEQPLGQPVRERGGAAGITEGGEGEMA